MKQKQILYSIIIITTSLFAFYGKSLLGKFVEIFFPSYILRLIYYYLWWLLPVIITIGILFGFKNILKELRLHKGFLFGLGFSFIAVLPMFVSSAMLGNIDKNLNITSLIHKTIIAGFFEELLFRAFLFGILFRKLGWGFIPASILGAFIFGIAHLYQASAFSEAISVFAVTSLGAIWFAWLFIEWKENIWIPIFLHFFMNLSWILFEVSNNASGNLYTNIFRIITIAITIIITIIYNKRKDKFSINKSNLIKNISL